MKIQCYAGEVCEMVIVVIGVQRVMWRAVHTHTHTHTRVCVRVCVCVCACVCVCGLQSVDKLYTH